MNCISYNSVEDFFVIERDDLSLENHSLELDAGSGVATKTELAGKNITMDPMTPYVTVVA